MGRNIFARAIALIMLMASYCNIDAAEVVYRIVEYNKTTGDFLLAASGVVPKGAWAFFENDFGATTGNRYNQIPRNKNATLYLEGWKGCAIKRLTLSMCSNNKSGQAGLLVADGENVVYSQRADDFASKDWFGEWVSKDFNVYVDITKELNLSALTTDEGSITIKGGTDEGSVYLNAITIEYDETQGRELVSPLGWTYERLAAKDKINDGDEVIIYRNGYAADDIDGMETSHYLDAVALASTSDVADYEVLRFKLGAAGDNMWTLTNQDGRRLGATGKQALAWNEGSEKWSIDLGYDGATITNEMESYGTMRFNAPAESYARFNLYTSKSLPLPFLYRKTKQREAIEATSLSFEQTNIKANLEDGHIALLPTLSPTAVTDKRLVWTSDNTDVATVNGGFVTLHSAGSTSITATTHNGKLKAMVNLSVENTSGIKSSHVGTHKIATHKIATDNGIMIISNGQKFGIGGERID